MHCLGIAHFFCTCTLATVRANGDMSGPRVSTTDIIDSADSWRLWLSSAAGSARFGPLLVSCFP